MTPAEAGAFEFEEPDWRERFAEHCQRWSRLPQELAESEAFEATLADWRRFHWTPIEVDGKKKRQPAGAVEAMVALAALRIFPPRFTIKDVPRDNATGYQADDHMWLSIAGEQWRITAVENRMLILERFMGDDSRPETKQIDLTKAKWAKHTDAALKAMGAS
jgi:hypothetical protein